MGETIPQATKRLMQEKFNINCEFKKINSISLEQVKKGNKIIHSFLLILISAKTKDKILFTNVVKNKKNIITSDYKLISKDLKKKTNIENIETLL